MRAQSWWMAVGFATLAAGAWAQTFSSPSTVNAGADVDLEEDRYVSHVVDHAGVHHAVWSSTRDFTGTSGSDADIWHSQSSTGAAGTWGAPVLVNSFGTSDAGEDAYPRLIVAPNGSLHCVWQSYSDYAGTGTDSDIFHAKWLGTAWGTATAVNSFAADDNAAASRSDRLPTVTVKPDGRLIVAWESTYPDVPGLPGGKGSDSDILYSVRTGATWSDAQILNTNAATDTGDDLGPVALATADDGTVYAAWSTNDDFRPTNPKGTDRDIVWSIWAPGYSWTELREACAQARSDTGTDRNPAIAVCGSGFAREFHLVWESNSPFDGSGSDYDLLHTLFGNAFPILPMNQAWHVNSTATTDAPGEDDVKPSLTIEPGGVLHCVWESTVNLNGLGSDRDIFISSNATLGPAWTEIKRANQNGFSDAAGENDYQPNLITRPDGLLSMAWHSSDDLGGTIGHDYDIFHALGFGLKSSRPEPINTSARGDGPDAGTDNDRDVSIAVGPDGTLHAVWASDNPDIGSGTHGTDYDIFYSVLTPVGWISPQLVNSTGATDSGTDRWPRLAIDGSGGMHVVWASNADLYGAGTDYDVFYSRNLGVGWSAPELVNSEGASDAGANIDDAQPCLAVDPTGVPRVVWVGGVNLGDLFTSHPDIFFSRRLPEGWTAAECVNASYAATTPGLDLAPDLALDPYGYAHVVWQSNANYNSADADWDIFYARQTDTGWSDVEFAHSNAGTDTTDDTAPALELSRQGDTIHVVWVSTLDTDGSGGEGDILYGWRNTSGVWTFPHLFSAWGATDTGVDFEPDMVRDALGQLHVVWRATNNAGADYDLLYARHAPGDFTPTADCVLGNASAFADTGNDMAPAIAMGRDGRAHLAWESDDSLGGRLGADADVLHSWHALDEVWDQGAPMFDQPQDNGDGSARLTWFNYHLPPAQCLGFAWDMYVGNWVQGGIDGSMWHDLSASPYADSMTFAGSGGYHVWISNLYDDGHWFPCANPITGILYSGIPHTPRNVSAANQPGRQVLLSWDPEIYGTWHYQIIAWEASAGWTTVTGPSGSNLWQFVFYPSANFMAGQAILTVPAAGNYTFFIRAASWLPPYTPPATGAYATASVVVP